MKTDYCKEDVYTANGYKNREDYLNSLAEEHGIDRKSLDIMADMLGENEDFDGLVIAIDDFEAFEALVKQE